MDRGFLERAFQLLWIDAELPPAAALDHFLFFAAFVAIEPHVKSLGLPAACVWSKTSAGKSQEALYFAVSTAMDAFRDNPATGPCFLAEHDLARTNAMGRVVALFKQLTPAALARVDVMSDLAEFLAEHDVAVPGATDRRVCRAAVELARRAKPLPADCAFADFECGFGGFLSAFARATGPKGPAVTYHAWDPAGVAHARLNALFSTGALLPEESFSATPPEDGADYVLTEAADPVAACDLLAPGGVCAVVGAGLDVSSLVDEYAIKYAVEEPPMLVFVQGAPTDVVEFVRLGDDGRATVVGRVDLPRLRDADFSLALKDYPGAEVDEPPPPPPPVAKPKPAAKAKPAAEAEKAPAPAAKPRAAPRKPKPAVVEEIEEAEEAPAAKPKAAPRKPKPAVVEEVEEVAEEEAAPAKPAAKPKAAPRKPAPKPAVVEEVEEEEAEEEAVPAKPAAKPRAAPRKPKPAVVEEVEEAEDEADDEDEEAEEAAGGVDECEAALKAIGLALRPLFDEFKRVRARLDGLRAPLQAPRPRPVAPAAIVPAAHAAHALRARPASAQAAAARAAYTAMTRLDLMNACKEGGYTGFSRFNKVDMVDFIMEKKGLA